MSELQVEGVALKKLIAICKKTPLPFGFNPSSKIEGCYLAMHRKKTAMVVGKDAKDEGPGQKAAFGTLEVDGKMLILKCERVVPSLAKTFKKYLMLQKVMLNIEVRDASGTVLESEIDENLPDDPEVTEAPTKPTVDKAALGQRLVALRKKIDALNPAQTEKLMVPYGKIVAMFKKDLLEQCAKGVDQVEAALPKAGKIDPTLAKLAALYKQLAAQAKEIPDDAKRGSLEKALAQAAGHIKAQKAPEATALLVKIRDALKKLLGAPPQGGAPGFEAWTKAHTELSDKIDAALSQGLVADVNLLRRNWNWAVSTAADKKFVDAIKPISGIRKMLQAGTADGKSAFNADIPADVKPFAESRVRWSFARSKMHLEMDKLKDMILTAVADDPDLSRDVTKNIGNLTSNLANIDSRLEDKLDQIVNEIAGDKRAGYRSEAQKLIAEYRTELASDFFQDVDQNSGFGNVAVLATAQTALAAIDTVLQ